MNAQNRELGARHRTPRPLLSFTRFQEDEMNSTTRGLSGLAVFAVGVLTTLCIQAQEPPPTLDHGSRLVSALGELSAQDLKAFYLRCDRAAMRGSLGSNDVALCSIAYDILLKGTFGGDFFALLAWSSSQSSEDTATAFHSVKPVERK